MAEQAASYIEQLQARFPDAMLSIAEDRGEVTLEVPAETWHAACLSLRDDFGFEQLVDLCGVDYLGYGCDEWETANVSSEGFSRGVELGFGPGRFSWENRPHGQGPVHRFATVAHLRSYRHNRLLRVRCYAANDELPTVASVTDIWPGANWFEREAFDLFGILYQGHPDLRRILTDYGFVGHPFRK
ncbi:MAG: NADH-quinone oxidoreductase subunit C, partial [Pseudoxanthomonas sp.]|nr:NADH-quinone oxidoreductase subunit C [Pseudoxanthomonas sp.]